MNKEKTENRKERRHMKNIWMIYTLILSLVSISLIINTNMQTTGKIISDYKTKTDIMSIDDAAKKAIDFINTYILQGQATAILMGVEEKSGIYNLKVRVMGRVYDSYITKDGKLLMLSAIDMNKKPEIQTQTTFDAPDREKPNVKFFVMSFCPFGNQAESGLAPVFRLLGEKVEWEPHYVIYSNYRGGGPDYCLDNESKYCSMHGIQELHQDVRELCIWKYYNHSIWWDFVLEINKLCNSRNADTCWEPIAKELNIDVNKINTCLKDEAESLLEKELELNERYGVRGSPTVFINDKQYSGGRAPENYKQAICSGFIDKPEECSQILGTTSSSASGGCE